MKSQVLAANMHKIHVGGWWRSGGASTLLSGSNCVITFFLGHNLSHFHFLHFLIKSDSCEVDNFRWYHIIKTIIILLFKL